MMDTDKLELLIERGATDTVRNSLFHGVSEEDREPGVGQRGMGRVEAGRAEMGRGEARRAEMGRGEAGRAEMGRVEAGRVGGAGRTGDTGRAGGGRDARHLLITGLLAFREGRYLDAMRDLEEALGQAETTGASHRLTHRIMNHLLWIGLKAGLQRRNRELFRTLDAEQRRMTPRERAFFLTNHAYAVSLDIGFIESERFGERVLGEALNTLREAERMAGGKDTALLARIDLVRGILHQQREDWTTARAILERGRRRAEGSGLVLPGADLMEELGNLSFREGMAIMAPDGMKGIVSGGTDGPGAEPAGYSGRVGRTETVRRFEREERSGSADLPEPANPSKTDRPREPVDPPEPAGQPHGARLSEGTERQERTSGDCFREAGNLFSGALSIWEGRNRDQEGVLLASLGEVRYLLGEYGEARELHGRALEIFRELGYRHGVGQQYGSLGRVLLRQGEVRGGIGYLKKALRVFRKLDDRHGALLTRVRLVDGHFLLSRRSGRRHLRNLLNREPVKRYIDCYRELRGVVFREAWLREDPEFRELFEKPLPRYITLELLEQIITAAKRAHPNEFGALIHGDPVLDRLEFVLDSARGRNTFMFSLYNRLSGDQIYADGSVHSHPGGAAVPSRADLSFFGRFPNVNIIIAYPYTLDSWAAYDRNGNRLTVEIIYREYKDRVEALVRKLAGNGGGEKGNES